MSCSMDNTRLIEVSFDLLSVYNYRNVPGTLRRKAVPSHLALVVGLDRIVANFSVGSVAAGFRKDISSSRILKNLANHVRGN